MTEYNLNSTWNCSSTDEEFELNLLADATTQSSEITSTTTDDDELFFSDFLDDSFEINKELSGLSADELPVFRIQSISPTAQCSPSPIDHVYSLLENTFSSMNLCDFNTQSLPSSHSTSLSTTSSSSSSSAEGEESSEYTTNFCRFDLNPNDFISLEELNGRIGTPQDIELRTTKNLETIFEGVFLETPPKKRQIERFELFPTKYKRIHIATASSSSEAAANAIDSIAIATASATTTTTTTTDINQECFHIQDVADDVDDFLREFWQNTGF